MFISRASFPTASEGEYYWVDLIGLAVVNRDGVVLGQMLQRYLGDTTSKLANWLLSRAEDEVLITIEPLRLFSWDYRERMGEG